MVLHLPPLRFASILPIMYFMGKKFLLCTLFIFLCFSLSAQAGLKIILEENDGKLIIVRSRGKTKELIIPETINNKPITEIAEGAFTRRGLTLVSIPDSVTVIGENAFSHNELTTLVIGNNVETIGNQAFSHNKLNDLTIGTGVKSIGMGAFADNQLVRVTLPDSIASIGPYAFFYNKLITVTIPGNVTTIGEGAFSSNRLYSAVIGGSVEEIGDGAFFNNQLTNITIPDSLTALGKRVFESRITKKGSVPPVDYLNENEEVIYTTANNFDNYFGSTGKRPGKYTFTRDGWTYEE